MWHNGISIFPWNTTWQSMKGKTVHFTFHLCRRTRMPPTTPEHSQSERCVRLVTDVRHVSCHPESDQTAIKKKEVQKGDTSEAIYLLLRCCCCCWPDTPPLPPLLFPRFVCAHFIPCAASWQAGQGLPSHHTPFPSHGAWGRNTRGPRQGQAKQLAQHCRHHHL